MIIIDGRLDRDSSMLRPPLLQWTTEYSHCTIRQVILAMAKSSGITSHRPHNHIMHNRYENGPWKEIIKDSWLVNARINGKLTVIEVPSKHRGHHKWYSIFNCLRLIAHVQRKIKQILVVYHLSKRQMKNELSTVAQARCMSEKIPQRAVPSPAAALYLSINIGGSWRVSATSTKEGHCSRDRICRKRA